jgi:beta-phosphoglucomutase-like phosphatase (HAD superfamily)
MKKLGFIFDMDGTMIDSMGYHAQSWALFAEAHHPTHRPQQALLGQQLAFVSPSAPASMPIVLSPDAVA